MAEQTYAPYCLHCEKEGHRTHECWSTHVVNARSNEIASLSAPPPAGAQQAVADEQQAFEAWAEARGNRLDKFCSALGKWSYESYETQAAYDAWRARAALAAPAGAQQAVAPEPVPDSVWEALQRMIEDGLVKGPASQEDARTVMRYRDRVRFLAAPAAAQGAVAILAAKHTGMRVDYSGLLKQAQVGLRREPALAEMLRQLKDHLTELGRRWYTGDVAVVDEILQLYCIEQDTRKALAATPAPEAAPSAKEGEADTARLDWIVRQGDEFSCSVIVDAPDDGEYRVHGMDNAYGQGKTAREAIDAAIKGLTPAGGDRG
ncbi:hypothetical protein [Variovorax atrisoli]|uniref:hypothetical protein n=1 Tax=Variovorax atrisoli TaxID=3394203 RepID=UPI00035E2843|nr:hypothetical protein [Variovorax paradoxus]